MAKITIEIEEETVDLLLEAAGIYERDMGVKITTAKFIHELLEDYIEQFG
ncbi:MAG: hypothetical protein ACFFCI_02345 [Promethearchaeota archaeon]